MKRTYFCICPHFTQRLQKTLGILCCLFLSACCQLQPGINHYQEGNYREALEDFQTLKANCPNLCEGYYWSGRAALKLEEFELAYQDFKKALACDPSKKELYETLGDVAFNLAKFEEAKGYLLEAKEQRALTADGAALLGEIYLNEKLCGKALDAFESALALDPDHSQAQIGRANAREMCNIKDNKSQTNIKVKAIP